MTWDWWVFIAVCLAMATFIAWIFLHDPMKGYDGSQIGGE